MDANTNKSILSAEHSGAELVMLVDGVIIIKSIEQPTQTQPIVDEEGAYVHIPSETATQNEGEDMPGSGGTNDENQEEQIKVWNPRQLIEVSDDDDDVDIDGMVYAPTLKESVEKPKESVEWSQVQSLLEAQKVVLKGIDEELKNLEKFFPVKSGVDSHSRLLHLVRKITQKGDCFLNLVQDLANLEVCGGPLKQPIEDNPEVSGNSKSAVASSSSASEGGADISGLCSYFRLLHALRGRLQKRSHRVCRSIYYVIIHRVLRILRQQMLLKTTDKNSLTGAEVEFDDKLMLNIRMHLDKITIKNNSGKEELEISTEKFLKYWDEVRSVPPLCCADQEAILADHQIIGSQDFKRQFKFAWLLDMILKNEQENVQSLPQLAPYDVVLAMSDGVHFNQERPIQEAHTRQPTQKEDLWWLED